MSTAVVTGAGGAIGWRIVEALFARGLDVIAVDCIYGKLENLPPGLANKLRFELTRLDDQDDVDCLFSSLPPDVTQWVLAAGSMDPRQPGQKLAKHVMNNMQGNLMPAVTMLDGISDYYSTGKGRDHQTNPLVVVISSVDAKYVLAGQHAPGPGYRVAKEALNALGEAMGGGWLGPLDPRLAILLPGSVLDPKNKRLNNDRWLVRGIFDDPDALRRLTDPLVGQRALTPMEFAEIVCTYLGSLALMEANHGRTIVLDRGLSLYPGLPPAGQRSIFAGKASGS
ncbi:MAG: hypothetical protein CEO22_568 [Candidatus Berkelbacteria bacterium Gr01-1014_85]|uniref:NAD-dependent epimerase/dehydratase domain-containing protein n=1 Tax=Candidatus Berkelbacteria bacterium Gr01-1014_85 TaxID=2017150 RepID=A0A554JA11_9BACT|nr:MAG: hypothetical protein CEO22_568 [Candidatus Berkelbacteria bacterium Gr01-1014_85]